MPAHKKHEPHVALMHGFEVRPKSFIFFDRATGTPGFELKATADGELPVDMAVSQLAMQCVASGRNPGDFQLTITTDADLLSEITPRVKRLVQKYLGRETPVQISPRQEEVLRAVAQNLSNKEIASKFHISVRTAKFHVSALLEKFRVPNRASLMLLARDSFAQTDKPSIVEASVKLAAGRDRDSAALRGDSLLRVMK
ncbi:MAG: response regulator transcription factor [Candidatus Acidiferrales bacterium]